MPGLASIVDHARRDIEDAWARHDEHQAARLEAERYARDPLLWINTHVTIASKFSDLGEQGRVQATRIRLFPDQELTISSWIDLPRLAATGEPTFRNLLVEKSRQIGETWALAATVCWLLHYHHTRGLFMHTRAAEVADQGWTIDSFFGRIKFIHDHLPAGVPGVGDLVFRPFATGPAVIHNPATGASVRGECQRDDPGRGSTYDWCIVDEAAHIQHGEAVHAALDDACPQGKVYLSTPSGSSNMHARLCDERPAGYTYLRLHWSTHPHYSRGIHVAGADNSCGLCRGTRDQRPWSATSPQAHRYPGKPTSPWYDQAVIGKTDEQVARELDIDRAAALSGRVYKEFDPRLHVDPDGVPYEEALHHKLELGWDYGLDCTAIVICQDAPSEYRVIGCLKRGDLLGSTATPEAVADALLAYLAELGVPQRLLTRDWTRRIHSVGDPAGASRDPLLGRPFVHAYHRLGFAITHPGYRWTRSTSTGISAVKRLLLGQPKPLRICGRNARELADDIANNRWPTDALGNRRLGATRPLDDIHNHACDALRYLVVSKWPPPEDGEDQPTPTREAERPPTTWQERYGRRRARSDLTLGGISPDTVF